MSINQSKKGQKKNVYIDMDGVMAKFTPASEEELFKKGFFLNLEPITNVINAIKELVKDKDTEVFSLSAYLTESAYALIEKNEWLNIYIKEIDESHRIFTPCGESKKKYLTNLQSNKDFLIDDYTENLLDWGGFKNKCETFGTGIKLLNGINHTNQTWKGALLNSSSESLVYDIRKIINQKQNLQLRINSKDPGLKDKNHISHNIYIDYQEKSKISYEKTKSSINRNSIKAIKELNNKLGSQNIENKGTLNNIQSMR